MSNAFALLADQIDTKTIARSRNVKHFQTSQASYNPFRDVLTVMVFCVGSERSPETVSFLAATEIYEIELDFKGKGARVWDIADNEEANLDTMSRVLLAFVKARDTACDALVSQTDHMTIFENGLPFSVFDA